MEALTDQVIKDFLETAALYTWKEYEKPKTRRNDLWIRQIDSFCETCDQMKPFQEPSSRGSGSRAPLPIGTPMPPALSSGISRLDFKCVTCQMEYRIYLIQHIVEENSIKLQKYGQLPKAKLERNPLLQKLFKKDLDAYEKAIVCEANGYGIGAFAYFRRIIEDNIGSLLDLIEEEAKASSLSVDVIEALQELRRESPMSERIGVANHALPGYLKTDGINPLGRLYKILSEGVHGLSDVECLEKASEVKDCLGFLVSELASRKLHREQFKKRIARL